MRIFDQTIVVTYAVAAIVAAVRRAKGHPGLIFASGATSSSPFSDGTAARHFAPTMFQSCLGRSTIADFQNREDEIS
jgi:hypothetical protein